MTMENNSCPNCPIICRSAAWEKEADAWLNKYADLKKKYDELKKEHESNEWMNMYKELMITYNRSSAHLERLIYVVNAAKRVADGE